MFTDIRWWTPLFQAIWYNHDNETGLIQLLIDSGAEMRVGDVEDSGSSTSLHIAALKGNLKLVEYFWNITEDKEPINNLRRNSVTPIYYAVQGNHLPVVEFFIEKGYNLEGPGQYNVSRSSNPLIIYALLGCDDEMVKFLIDKVQDKCPSNSDGLNVLHLAASKNLQLGL